MRRVFLAAIALMVSAAGAAEPPKVLRVAFSSAETGFDPARISDIYSRSVTPHIFEAPFGYDPLARPTKVVPRTAAAMPEHSDDYRIWTIRLKPGIFFAEDPAFGGKPRELVAADYVYSWKRVIDPANRSPSISGMLEIGLLGMADLRKDAVASNRLDYARELPGLRAIDRYTLRLETTEPRPRLPETFADSSILGAVAREVVERYGERIDEHPVGTGPFRLVSWRRTSRIVLERNPGYRETLYDAAPEADDAEGQAILARMKGRRLPIVDRVEVSIIEEGQPRWLAFLNGEIDGLVTKSGSVPLEFAAIAMPNGKIAPNLEKRGIVGVRTLNADTVITYFNMEDPIVGGYTPDKVALRRAIGLAYDTEREIVVGRRGQAIPAQSPVPPFTSGYDPQFKSEMSEYSPSKAKALLDVYGYLDRDGDGYREMPDGSPLTLVMATQGEQIYRLMNDIWLKDMAAVGLRMRFDIGQWADQLKTARSGKLMIWGLGSSATTTDGQESLQRWYGPQSGGQNYSRFALPTFDALYERMLKMPDGPEREALLREAKLLAVAYMPYKVHVHRISNDVYYNWLIGYRRPILWNDWWHYADVDTALRTKMLKK